MDIDGVTVLNGRIVTANIETSETLPTTNLSNGRIVYLTQVDGGNVVGLYVYTVTGWEVITNSGYVTGVNAGYGLLGGGNGGTVTLDVDTSEIATIAITDNLDNVKFDKTGGTLTGNLDMDTNLINNVGAPSVGTDVTNKDYVDSQITGSASLKVDRAGDTMSGDLDLDSNFLLNVPTATDPGHATNKGYVDTEIANKDIGVGTLVNTAPGLTIINVGNDYNIDIDYTAVAAVSVTDNLDFIKLNKAGDTMSGNLDMAGTNIVTGLAAPTNNSDATNKSYVDAAVNGVDPLLFPISTTSADSVYFVTFDGSGNGRRSTKANINISEFNDDLAIWHAGNVGPGSGLDADTVDGIHADSFVRRDAVTIMTANLNMNSNVIFNVPDPTDPTHAVNKEYLDQALVASLGLKMDKSGGSFTGPVFLNANPISPAEAATKAYVDSVASGGGGTGTFADGNPSAPSITFTNDLNTGIYRYGIDVVGVAAGGAHVARFTNQGFVIDGPAGLRTLAGAASSPAINFSSDIDTGLYLFGSNQLGFTAGGIYQAHLDTDGFNFRNNYKLSFDGTGVINAKQDLFVNLDSNGDDVNTTNFVIAKNTDTTSGGTDLFRVRESGDVLVYSGSELSNTVAASFNPAGIRTGDISSDNYTRVQFKLDTDSYGVTGSSSGLSVLTNENGNQVQAMVLSDVSNISANDLFAVSVNVSVAAETTGDEVGWDKRFAVTGAGQIKAVNGSASLPSYTFDSDTNTGLYLRSTDEMGYAANGAESLRFTTRGMEVVNTTASSWGTDFHLSALRVITPTDASATWLVTHENDDGTDRSGIQSLNNNNHIRIFTGGGAYLSFTDRLRISSGGAAATPAFAFESDIDTGMYLSSTNEVSLAAGGTQMLQVAATSVTSFSEKRVQKGAGNHVTLVDTSDNTINMHFVGTAGDEQSIDLIYEASNGNLLEDGYALKIVSGGTPPQVGELAHLEVEGNIYSNGNLVLTTANNGSGNGIDADTVDGLHAASFVRSDANDLKTGSLTLQDAGTRHLLIHNTSNGGGAGIQFSDNSTGSYAQQGYFDFRHSDSDTPGSAYGAVFRLGTNESSLAVVIEGTGDFYAGPNLVYHQGNDGSGSGLDADLLDGLQSTSFVRSDASDIMTGQYDVRGSGASIVLNPNQGGSPQIGFQDDIGGGGDNHWAIGADDKDVSYFKFAVRASGGIPTINTNTSSEVKFTIRHDGVLYAGSETSGNIIWHAGNDGAGSGLDADTVDGLHASELAQNENYRTDTSTATLSASDVSFANTSGGGFTLNLPSSPSIGDQVTIMDVASTFDTNTLTVGRNGSNIMGLAENMTIGTQNASVTLIYSGNATFGWRIRH